MISVSLAKTMAPTVQCEYMWQSARYHSALAAALITAWAQIVFKDLEIKQAYKEHD